MSDTNEIDGKMGERSSPKKTKYYSDLLAKYADILNLDDDDMSEMSMVDVMPLSGSAELRAISIPVLMPPKRRTSDEDVWLIEEPTWMLPAVTASPNNNALRSLPTTRDAAKEKEQARSGVQNYLSLALEMVKSSGIYAVGALVSPLASLILSVFLAKREFLSKADYGNLNLLYTIIDLVTVITQLGLASAFFRAYNSDYESAQDRSGVLATTIILLLLFSIPIGIVIIVASPWISTTFFDTPAYGNSVALTAMVIVMENLTLPCISWFRAEKRPLLYSVLSIANLLIVLLANYVLVGRLHAGINGALIAKGAGFAAIIVSTLPFIVLRLARKHNFYLRFDIVKSMLAFGVPTIFSDIANWVLQVSDRQLLKYLGSSEKVATYSVVYILGGVLSPILLAPWGLAWIPIMYAVAKRDDAAQIYKLVFRWWSSVLLFAAFGLSLVSTFALDLFYDPSYLSGEPVIPIITLSTMLLGVWYIFMIGVNIRRKTIYQFIYVLIAASVNLLLNLFLIPRYGIIGAAVSTLIAYILLAIMSYIINQRIYPIAFEVGSFVLRLAIGIVLYVVSSLLAHTQRPLVRWSISIVAFLLYGVILLLLAGVTPQKIVKAFGFVRTMIEKEWQKRRA